MRLRSTLFLVCATAVMGLQAQDGPPQRPNFIRFHPVLSALDTNQDGELSAAELQEAPTALAKLDADKDGSISAEEMRPRFGGPGGPRGGPGGRGGGPGEGRPPDSNELVKTLMSFDANADGKLQKAEVPDRMQGLFERADKDHDGVLSQAELVQLAEAQGQGPAAGGGGRGERGEGGPRGERGGPRGGMRMDAVMTALDADKDGVISPAEIKASTAALKTLDKNGDGKITEDEVRPNFGGRGERGPEGGFRRGGEERR